MLNQLGQFFDQNANALSQFRIGACNIEQFTGIGEPENSNDINKWFGFNISQYGLRDESIIHKINKI